MKLENVKCTVQQWRTIYPVRDFSLISYHVIVQILLLTTNIRGKLVTLQLLATVLSTSYSLTSSACCLVPQVVNSYSGGFKSFTAVNGYLLRLFMTFRRARCVN